MDKERIGVFLCHCGTNIAHTVDIEKVKKYAESLPGVIFVKDYKYMCSDPGQRLIKESIKENGLTRVVVAACTPRLHESTFRETLREVGLNPYTLEIANIREHCSWVHDNREIATEKAKDIIRIAAMKAGLLEPLEEREIEAIKEVLIIGGGIAGISTALVLANSGLKTYIVEKEPSIGGKMAQLDKTFPTLDCSACILTPLMVDVDRNPLIEILSYSEVENVEGYIGNFKVKVRRKPRFVREDLCTSCGLCWENCPSKKVPNEFDLGLSKRTAIYIPFPQAVPAIPVIDTENCRYFQGLKEGKERCKICQKECTVDAVDYTMEESFIELEVGAIVVATGYEIFDATQRPQYGYGKYEDVIIGLQFERLISASGPTESEIIRPSNGQIPKSVTFINCVGSKESDGNQWCCRYGCMASLKHALQVKEKYPEVEVNICFTDMRAFGKGYEELYRRCRKTGINFIKGLPSEIYETYGEEKHPYFTVFDGLLNEVIRVDTDLLVLQVNMVSPKVTGELVKKLGLCTSEDGFFQEAHAKLRPIETPTPGVFLAGTCQGPKDIVDVVCHAKGAGGDVLKLLQRGMIKIEPISAEVNEELC
ncbi:MAG: FAD-dependent oxidoreductase, partial [Asgard group archaeon]